MNDISLDNVSINNKSSYDSTNRVLKIILTFCVVLLVILIGFVCFLYFRGSDKYNRTIMIYMVGSDLESENKIATYDLSDINPTNIDLKNTNVILMTGGAVKWHNYVSSEELAIYELTVDGFKRSVSYELDSMGDSETLSDFMNYVYDNYNSDKYDLIFWDHGIGAYGIESDEIYKDYLTITELNEAMEYSPFNVENKLNSVLFINCLSANLHFANVMSEYANYMIASEELSYGNSSLDKLNFIENIEKDDDGYEYGMKFISNLSESVNRYNSIAYKNIDSTYSIIDLSKIPNIVEELNSVVSQIDVLDNYSVLSKLRGNIVTYGKEVKSYDTVDLYTLVYGFKSIIYSEDIDNLLLDIKDAVVHNWALNSYSYGLSVYFPFYGSSKYVMMHFDEFKDISNDEYLSFIQEFNNKKNSNYTSLNFSRNFGAAIDGYFSLLLDNDQVSNYMNSSVIVLKKMNNGNFVPMYTSSDTFVTENDVLIFDYKGKALEVIDKKDGSSSFLYLSELDRKGDYVEYLTFALLQDLEGNSIPVEVYISVDSEHPNGYISKVVKKDDELPSMVILELEDYSDMFFVNFEYDVFDDFGNYIDEWTGKGNSYLFRVGTSENDFEFRISDIVGNSDYYCVFKINDINNYGYYSNLISIR